MTLNHWVQGSSPCGCTIFIFRKVCAPIAQSVEQMTLNHWVQGSSPCGCTIFFALIPEQKENSRFKVHKVPFMEKSDLYQAEGVFLFPSRILRSSSARVLILWGLGRNPAAPLARRSSTASCATKPLERRILIPGSTSLIW